MKLALNIKDLEKSLHKKLKRDTVVLGIDTASTTGWAILSTEKNLLYIDYGVIKINTKDRYFKYNEIINIFSNLIKEEYDVIVEDTFFRFNPKMYRMISRIGAIAYTIAYLRGCNVKYIGPSTARKNLGIKGNAKKIDAHAHFHSMTGLNFVNADVTDALILSFNGLLVEETCSPLSLE